MDHNPTLVRQGYDVRYVCSCGWATGWYRDMATAGAAIVRHAARSEEWAA